MQPEENAGGNDNQRGDSAVWSILSGSAGISVGLLSGFFLFVWSYRPLTGLGNTPIWQVSVMDGILIIFVGGVAFRFRKKSGFVQGIVISAVLLFIVNGLCGLGGR